MIEQGLFRGLYYFPSICTCQNQVDSADVIIHVRETWCSATIGVIQYITAADLRCTGKSSTSPVYPVHLQYTGWRRGKERASCTMQVKFI